jgi:hypothetical protein
VDQGEPVVVVLAALILVVVALILARQARQIPVVVAVAALDKHKP